MTKKLLLVLAVLIVGLAFAGCAFTSPVCATSNPVGSKVGTSSSTLIFGFAPDGGDTSILSAAQAGGIKKISTVDSKFEMVFFYLVMKHTTIVSGE